MIYCTECIHLIQNVEIKGWRENIDKGIDSEI
jgi:hypothetical protein